MTNPFQFPNGQLAYSAEDLLELCQKFPDDGIHYLVREDLEKWLSYIGKEDIAQCAASARQTPLEDRQKLEEFLNKCHALSSPQSRDLPETTTEPLVEAPPEPTPIATKTPVVEAPLEPTPIATKTPVVEAKPIEQGKTFKASTPSNSASKKPSFFKVIAGLIINVLYRNKN